MDRKEFLKTAWKKGLKPVLLVAVIYFCANFLYNIFTENGTERFVTKLILALGLLFALFSLIGLVLGFAVSKIHSRLPEKIKLVLIIIGKYLGYVAPVVLGAMVYHFWQEDWVTASIVIAVFMIQRIIDVIKDEKKTGHNKL